MQINSKRIIIFVTLIAASVSLLQAQKMPQWVTMPSSVYPLSQYISATGEGKDKTSAELSAVNNLAAIFSQNIDSKVKATSRLQNKNNSGIKETKTSSDLKQQILRNVNENDLAGVEVRETFHDTSKNVYYAVAVMDREKAFTAISSQVNNNNASISRLLSSSSKDQFSLEEYSRLDYACDLSLQNRELINRLLVINPESSAAYVEKAVSPEEIKKQMIEVAKQIPVCILVKGDFDNQTTQALASLFSDRGFRISDNPDERYVLRMEITYETRIPKDSSTVQFLYNAEGFLSDTILNEKLLPIHISGKEGSVDKNNARLRMYRAITSTVKTKTAQSLDTLIKSLHSE